MNNFIKRFNDKIKRIMKDSNKKASAVDLELILKSTPGYVYWKDLNSVYMGCNKNMAFISGLNRVEDIIGKTDKDLSWGASDPKLVAYNLKVDRYIMKTGQSTTTEETIGIKSQDGVSMVVKSEKIPLRDKNGNIVGIFGISIDITSEKEAQKEAERLKLEAERLAIDIEFILKSTPGYVYWKDLDSVYIGCNQNFAEVIEFKSPEDVVGKTDYDLPYGIKDPRVADKFRQDDMYVIKNLKSIVVEDYPGTKNAKGQEIVVRTEKIPLMDKAGNVMGVLGIAVDLTEQKEAEGLAIDIEFILKSTPGYMYWKDLDSVYRGCNQNLAEIIGFKSPEDIIGKTDYDLPHGVNDVRVADKFRQDDLYVITNLKSIVAEDNPGVKNAKGRDLILRTEKKPLINKAGNVIGILGIAVDITEEKEAERLALENQAHKIIQEQQRKFKKIVEQVVHDIRSPISSLQMILPMCHNLPEHLRVPLNKAATRIRDIANNLLNKFKPKEPIIIEEEIDETALAPTLISAELLEIITEKKYEYTQLPIDFNTHISQMGYFAFINADIHAFKRMISNLINNAVEACEGKIGEITVALDVVDGTVQIMIQDNGKGMPEEVKTNILNNIAVTADKEKGHGIGFEQIRTTLEKSQGTLDIESTIGAGTKIILSFPKIAAPAWMAEKIELYSDDIIVILDDDDSIHGAWNAKFKQAAPEIKLTHFKEGHAAVSFINDIPATQKDRVFLLTDYELLSEDLHGLDVVDQTGVKRSVLVTSHHNSSAVRDLAQVTNTRILPKPLASEVAIHILKTRPESNPSTEIKKIDAIFVDDDKDFLDVLVRVIESNDKIADTYYTAHELLNNIQAYAKDTKIFLDNQFSNENTTGIELAKQLHELGYRCLYLFSGHDFSEDNSIPNYLTPVLKTDIDFVENLLNKE